MTGTTNGATTGTAGRDQRPKGRWSVVEVAADTFRGFRADRGFDLAGSLAFTTILTAVPLLATFSLFLVTFFRENDDQILAIVNVLLPYQTVRLTQNLKDFIAESTAISGVGLLLLVAASVRLVFVVEGVFNAVWGAPRRRASAARLALFTFALLALGLVLGGIGWFVRAARHSIEMHSVVSSTAFAAIAPFLLKAFFLALLYRYLPNARVRLAAAVAAGGAVALALELLRLLFGLYAEAMQEMNLITGSLGLVFFAILSLYFAWALILLGVEMTHVLQTHVARAGALDIRGGRAEMAIRMLLQLSSRRPTPLATIDADPAVSAEILALLTTLQAAGLVQGDEETGFQLALSARKITVARIVEALTPDLYRVSPASEDRVALVLEPLFFRIEAEGRSLLNATLADLRR